jgi:hypothetical protein
MGTGSDNSDPHCQLVGGLPQQLVLLRNAYDIAFLVCGNRVFAATLLRA